MNEYENEGMPASASSDGKRNAFYVRCKQVGYCRPYAACVNHAAQVELGEATNALAPCEHAIRVGTCPALAMRREEVLEDRAIYFKARRVSEVAIQDQSGTSVVSPSRLQSAPKVSANLPKQEINVIAGDYAAAINQFNNAAAQQSQQ